ncbi:MAG: outer membrane protein assembly factor BamD [Saprospiraceae bacterium]|jgi:outer membrane protein assembly factor BamD|nr:outer membrane protein assembly factor BamD [Saprospiraceae bacterium]
MNRVLIILFFAVLLMTSCKSKFETVRTSQNPELVYNSGLDYYNQGDWYRAQSLFEIVLPLYRGKEQAEELYYKYAYTHYNVDQFILAAHYFDQFSKTFYNSDKKEEARFMSAFSNYRLSPNYKLDQTYTLKAIEAFQDFTNTFPRSDRVQMCNDLIDEMREKLEDKAYYGSKLYYTTGYYESALSAFGNMLKDFPGSENAQEVRFLMVKSAYIQADNSIYDKKEDRFLETAKLYNEYKRKYETSKYDEELYEIFKETTKQLQKFKV